jgi:DNA modification methylase
MAKKIEDSWPASKTELWPLERIVPYPGNPRQHSPAQVDLIARSMKDDGVTAPILVDEDGTIIYGHGRRLAAEKNAFTKYPVVVARGWTDEQKRAYRIKDNSYALLSTWSEDLLRVELTDLSTSGYEMPLLGFDDVQLVSFLSVPSGADPERTPEPPAKPITRVGDLWQLGKHHRLLCGDSTTAEDVERLLDGRKPNLMVTDPPYGVEYDPEWRADANKWKGSKVKLGAKAIGKVTNDEQADWRKAWENYRGDVAYVWHGGLRSVEQAESLEATGFLIRTQIIWNKGRIVIGRGDYHWQHEACWYAVRKGRTGHWQGSRTEATVWDIAKPQISETGHSTQKPIECMRRPIQNNSKPGEFVYEPFAGSGTTIIAAEMMNRYCLAIELAPAYVDVCVERWQTFAKGEAVLVGDGRTFAEITKARKRGKDAPGHSGKPVPWQHANGNGKKQAVRKRGNARQPAAKREPAGEPSAMAGDS